MGTLHYFIKLCGGISGQVKVETTTAIGDICDKICEKFGVDIAISQVVSNYMHKGEKSTLPQRVDACVLGDALDFGEQVGERFTNGLNPELVHIVAVWLRPSVASVPFKRRRLSDSPQTSGLNYDVISLAGKARNPVMTMWKKYWGVALPEQFLGRSVSASDSRIEVKGGDLLPEAPFLNDPWDDKRFLVRAEYIRIYEFVEKSFAENAKSSMLKPPAVVITGQPGIALRRRLGEKRPTMLLQNGCYLFTESGVKEVPERSKFFMSNGYKKPPWCLIDSANVDNGIPKAMSSNKQSGVNPVYVSSPTVDQWKKLHQSKTRYLAIMNPWTREEINIAARTLLTKVRADAALTRFEKFGPVPRICLEYDDEDILVYESYCQSAIDWTDNMADELWSIAGNGTYLNMDATQGSVAGEHVLLIVSKDMANRCAARLRQLNDDEVLRVWNLLPKCDKARGMMGSIFEAYVHGNFRSQITIDGLEMFQFRDGRYHASFAECDDKPWLKAARSDLQEFKIDFRPRCTDVFLDGDIAIQPDTYYQPESIQQVGIDAFFMHGGYLYLVQMTGGYTHSIKASLEDFLGKLKGIPSEDKWRFVFMIPKNLKKFQCQKRITVGTVFTGKFAMAPENED